MDEPTAQLIKDELVEAGLIAVRSAIKVTLLPNTLYHFTNCEGLMNILLSRSLWASLAFSLGDDSEIRYGVDRAKCLLRGRQLESVEKHFRERVVHFLDPKNTFIGSSIELHPYMISFCVHSDRSVHWLHYGRQGTGYAIGFDVSGLVQNSFELAQVIYDESVQDKLLESIIEPVWRCVLQHRIERQESPASRLLFDVAAHSIASHIRAVAPALKNQVFANEEEWRLFTYDLKVTHRKTQPAQIETPKKFRVVAGRIVPYIELSFDEVPVSEIVFGASVSMQVDDPAFTILLRETVGDRAVKITKSEVPIRP
jgi:hypothetical protein